MKKHQLFIILLVVMVLLVLADYKVTNPEGLTLPQQPDVVRIVETPTELNDEGSETTSAPSNFNITKSVLESNATLFSHSLEKRTRSSELFETFDISRVANLIVYKNVLIDSTKNGKLPIYIYEIQGPAGQAKVGYLNLKLAMTTQLSAEDTVNETSQFGSSSLFYNNNKNLDTGYLLTQIGENIFGFKYSKKSEDAFNTVQNFIETYQSLINS